jgi:hypothetical protein
MRAITLAAASATNEVSLVSSAPCLLSAVNFTGFIGLGGSSSGACARATAAGNNCAGVGGAKLDAGTLELWQPPNVVHDKAKPTNCNRNMSFFLRLLNEENR